MHSFRNSTHLLLYHFQKDISTRMNNKVQDNIFWDLERPPSTFFLLDSDLSFLPFFITGPLYCITLVKRTGFNCVCKERLNTNPKFPIFVLISPE